MATIEKNTLLQKKNGTDIEIIYPITKKENILDLDSTEIKKYYIPDTYVDMLGLTIDEIQQFYPDELAYFQEIVDYCYSVTDTSKYPEIYLKDIDNPSSMNYIKCNLTIVPLNIILTITNSIGITEQPNTTYASITTIKPTKHCILIKRTSKTNNTISSLELVNRSIGVASDLPFLRTDDYTKLSTPDDIGQSLNEYVPTLDYNPATKKYVDDNIKTVSDKVTSLENKNVAELDESGKIPSSQLPSYVDDVLEFENKSTFPTTGESGKIYVAKDTNLTWRWSGTDYVEISPSIALGETSSTAFRGDYGKLAYQHAITNKGIEQATKGLYKFKTNIEGHITEATAITKQDILDLGIVATDFQMFQSLEIRNITVPQGGILQFLQDNTWRYKVLEELEQSLFVFLNGEKLSNNIHYTSVIENGYIVGIQITDDWDINTNDYIDIISIFMDYE